MVAYEINVTSSLSENSKARKRCSQKQRVNEKATVRSNMPLSDNFVRFFNRHSSSWRYLYHILFKTNPPSAIYILLRSLCRTFPSQIPTPSRTTQPRSQRKWTFKINTNNGFWRAATLLRPLNLALQMLRGKKRCIGEACPRKHFHPYSRCRRQTQAQTTSRGYTSLLDVMELNVHATKTNDNC